LITELTPEPDSTGGENKKNKLLQKSIGSNNIQSGIKEMIQ
jgi:hypothetical protein